jgi:hypothetical protein
MSKPLISLDGCNFRKGNSLHFAGSLIRNAQLARHAVVGMAELGRGFFHVGNL